MNYAAVNGYTVFTHDLDFGAMLAKTGAKKPSVIQIRTAGIDLTTNA
jgi:predicted nuclease of predicted toxin-antitoxin system